MLIWNVKHPITQTLSPQKHLCFFTTTEHCIHARNQIKMATNWPREKSVALAILHSGSLISRAECVQLRPRINKETMRKKGNK